MTSSGDGRGLDPFGQPYRPGRGLDTIGWFIATSHQILGHDKTAALLGVPPGDKGDCLICAYEADPDDERKAAVIGALMAGKPQVRPGSSGRPERPDDGYREDRFCGGGPR